MTTIPMVETYPRAIDIDRTQLAEAIETLLACSEACTACADSCLAEDDVDTLIKCVRINLDCADICATTARVVARHTENDPNISRAQLYACAVACKVCGDECTWHAGRYEHCRVCAEACRACETACRDLIAATS